MLKKRKTLITLSKLRRKIISHLSQFRFGLIIIGVIFLFLIYKTIYPILNPYWQVIGKSIAGGISLISQSADSLKGTNGRVNFLLLGIGGGDRIAADLTDTIIFVSIDPQTGNTLIFSLPRDIWIASIRAKLNTAYHYGNEKKTGGGLILAKALVAEILGQPVDYGIVIDFNGFEEIINLLGGVEVEVERGFDDYRYPISGMENADCGGDPEYQCRYEHLHFESGKQIMDGEKALKYVRSRFAEGEEGTDYARSRRQQRLMIAIKNRLFSLRTLVNPFRVIQLIKVINQNLETDITQKDWGGMAKLLLKIQKGKIKTALLDGGIKEKEGFLITPPPDPKKYDNHWVLIPRTGNWEEIQNYVKNLIENSVP